MTHAAGLLIVGRSERAAFSSMSFLVQLSHGIFDVLLADMLEYVTTSALSDQMTLSFGSVVILFLITLARKKRNRELVSSSLPQLT